MSQTAPVTEINASVLKDLLQKGHPRYKAKNGTGKESIQEMFGWSTAAAKSAFKSPALAKTRVSYAKVTVIDDITPASGVASTPVAATVSEEVALAPAPETDVFA